MATVDGANEILGTECGPDNAGLKAKVLHGFMSET